MNAKYLLLAAPMALLSAAPGHAAITVNPGTCDSTLINPDAVACSGYFAGNLLSGSQTQAQIDGLGLIGGTFDGNWTNLVNMGNVVNNGVGGVTASNIFFSTPMSGITYIGAHWGNAPNGGGNDVTAFFKLNLAPGTTSISLDNIQGFSNAALYSTVAAVPEASTWAMMLVGLGGVAWALRRKRQVSTTARISFA